MWKLDKITAIHLSQSVQCSKNVVEWVRQCVACETNDVSILTHFIQTAEQTLLHKNWQTTANILLGLEKTVTQELIKKLPEDIKVIYTKLKTEIGLGKPPETSYLKMINNLKTGPAIPWIGPIIHHMDCIETQHPNLHHNNQYLINFEKCSEFFSAIVQWCYHQENQYEFRHVPTIQDFIITSILHPKF